MEAETVEQMTYKDICNRMDDIRDDMTRLNQRAEKEGGLLVDDETRFEELGVEFDTLDNQRKKLERDAALLRVKQAAVKSAAGAGRVKVERPFELDSDPLGEPDSVENHRFKNPWDTSEIRMGLTPGARVSEMRSRALCAIERMAGANDATRQVATNFVERYDSADGRLASLVLATSAPAYVRAFAKLYSSNSNMASLDVDETAAVQRAMSLTDAAGGYLIPFQLDPTVILTAAGSLNQIRGISRVVTATGDVWNGISSAGVTGSWDGEATEVSDDAPTIAQPTVPVYKLQIFVPASLEVAQDGDNVAGEVARMIAFEKDRMEAVAFATGSGTNEPTGIVTALTGGSFEVDSATADTFAIADVYALDSALPARYRMNASWLGHRAIYNLVRRFDTQGGAGLWEYLGGGVPNQLLGRPVYESEAMDSSITALAANLVLVYGDFQNYVIADRIGTTIQFIPFLMGSNRRPTGQVGWYAYARVGADSVNDGAFRMLDVT
jgi:HK97 family phage major capsid protein